jgi:serine protease Do
VLTNAHVVEGAEEIIVRTSDRREFVATLVGTDKRSDIALLKIEGEGLPAVKIGASQDLKVGEWVLAIGSPFGFESSATAGIVSAKGRSLPSENYIPFIQTDVAINPGNSGGPLFNLDGEVVGVNSQIYSRTGGFMGLSFSIPIDVVMDVVDQLQTKGRVSRGWLGVLIQDVTRELAETFGMKQPRGALVAQILPGSPAEAAKVQSGRYHRDLQRTRYPDLERIAPHGGDYAGRRSGEAASAQRRRAGRSRGRDRRTARRRATRLPGERAGEGVRKSNRPLRERDHAEQREQLAVAAGGVLVEGVEKGPRSRPG